MRAKQEEVWANPRIYPTWVTVSMLLLQCITFTLHAVHLFHPPNNPSTVSILGQELQTLEHASNPEPGVGTNDWSGEVGTNHGATAPKKQNREVNRWKTC